MDTLDSRLEDPSAQRTAAVFIHHGTGIGGLRVLLARGVKVILVVTHDDSLQKATSALIKTACKCRGATAPCILMPKQRVSDLIPRIRELYPDLIFVFPYRRTVVAAMQDQARLGTFSLRGSLLEYYSKSPINLGSLPTENERFVTLHKNGPGKSGEAIIEQSTVPVFQSETPSELLQKVSVVVEQVLWNAFPTIVERTFSHMEALVCTLPFPHECDFTAGQGCGLVALPDPTQQAYTASKGVDQTLSSHSLLEKRQFPQIFPVTDCRNEVPSKRIFILGINGFIGHHLCKRILETTDWSVCGIDVSSHRIERLITRAEFLPRVAFKEADIEASWSWIESHIGESDVIIPLAAISTPASYIKTPLRIFELDFETNLRVVRLVVQKGKRLIFPSTSEVYGMCHDSEFDPDSSELICGPIKKTRWMYSCAKQLLDRVIFAYGNEGLDYTLFRPFNWIGPGLDTLDTSKPGISRVTSQFLGNIIRGETISLVDGGSQRRAFTYIDDGIDALTKIIVNENGVATGKIYNIGNPANYCTIRTLATMMIKAAAADEQFAELSGQVQLQDCRSTTYYGEGYQDLQHRLPSITETMADLQWSPLVSLEDAITRLFRELRVEGSPI